MLSLHLAIRCAPWLTWAFLRGSEQLMFSHGTAHMWRFSSGVRGDLLGNVRHGQIAEVT